MINRGVQSFDFTVDVQQALLWQYDNAPNIQALIAAKQLWYDNNQFQFWTDWYNNVFNLATATVFGLSVWSIILDIPLAVNSNPDGDKPIFGFNAYDPTWPTLENTNQNFGFGNFSSSNGGIILTIEEQRLLLQIRAYQLVSSGNIWDINAFFEFLFTNSVAFAGDTIWVQDNLNMTITYVFNWAISYNLLQALTVYDVLPRPAGVGIIYTVL